MQRPFNGGCNGGGMIRTVQRVIRAGVGGAPPEPLSTATSSASTDARKSNNFSNSLPNTPFTLSSSSSSTTNVRERFPCVINDVPVHLPGDSNNNVSNNDWECVEGISSYGYNNDEYVCEDYHVFGTVPLRDEVVNAVSALQQFLDAPLSSMHSPTRKLSELTGMDARIHAVYSMEKTSSDDDHEIEDWIEPSLSLCASRTLQPLVGTERVYDAFHLLKNEPSVQRMVVSLSSDKAVWDAVMDNEVVKELTSAIGQAGVSIEKDSDNGSSDDDSNQIKNLFSWIISNAKTRVMQLIDKITKLVNEILPVPNEGNEQETAARAHHPLEDKLKASLMLSIVVLLIVIVTRAQST